MARIPTAILAGIALLLALAPIRPAAAQKSGGVLRVQFFDSPASMSIHEESTIAGQGPMMGVFNNLVMYDQGVPQSGLKSVVADLAQEWSWDQSGSSLTFKLRHGVKWHDGKPFTARDVKCTFDLLQGKAAETLRVNPRKAWYGNLETVVVKADDEVTFKLKRPQPAFIALLASGFTPIYPCHVTPVEMRRRPIGTGPFKFVEFKPNEVIKDIKEQSPQAICQLVPTNVQRNVLINRDALPFNRPELRRAVALTVNRRAFIDTLTQGKGDIGGALLAPPEGVWGMPVEFLQTLPGYHPDVAKNRAEARQIMEKEGYGANNRLKLKV